MGDEVKYEKGEPMHVGKTKTVFAVQGHPDLVICENRNDITADDDPRKTRQFATKAACATFTTCRIFELLNASGVPTAYIKQLSPTSFLAHKSSMVKLEIVGRRLAVGSMLKRRPDLMTKDAKKPYRFHRLKFELFLKTSGQDWQGQTLPCDDPWIVDPYAAQWDLAAPKAPLWDTSAQKGFFQVLPSSVLQGLEVKSIEALLRKVFLIIEGAWAGLSYRLVDIKIEIDSLGRVSDVVDNDSWRLWAPDGKQVDKQVFRDFGDSKIEEVEANYALVSKLSERLIVPQQTLVLWKASKKDPDFKIGPDTVCPKNLPGVTIVHDDGSAHKGSVSSLRRLEAIFRDHPGGGVIAVKVGRSNGAGPTFAAHSPWPVVTVPDTYKEFSDDIHSSTRCPSQAPNMTCWPEENALLAALKILALANPAVYAHVQGLLEEQDDYLSE